MRRFELILLIAALSDLLWLSFGNGLSGSLFSYLPFLCAVLGLAQIAAERFRWQMLPVYALVAYELASYPAYATHHFRMRLTVMVLLWLAAAGCVAAAGLLAGVLYPVFAFEALTGKYPVGTFSLPVRDEGRMDPYARGESVPRELMLQFWYPAEKAAGSGRRTPYRDGRQDNWLTSNFPLVETRSFRNVRIAQEGGLFPAIVFSGPENRFQNTFQTEELASHGYVVVGVDHPYAADKVNFPDGRTISRRKANVFLEFESDPAFEQSIRDVTADLSVRAGDLEFVIAALKSWQQPDAANPIAGRVDASRIGLLGHSFGGAVAAEVCIRDRGVRAGINMDGWLFGRSQREGVPQPFFFMLDATPKPDEAQLQSPDETSRRMAQRTLEGYEDVERSLARHGGWSLQAPGLEHMNYTDTPLFSQWKAKTGAGRINIRKAHSMINRFSIAFFDTYLKGKPDAALDYLPAEFPEATFRRVEPVPGRTCFSYEEASAAST